VAAHGRAVIDARQAGNEKSAVFATNCGDLTVLWLAILVFSILIIPLRAADGHQFP